MAVINPLERELAKHTSKKSYSVKYVVHGNKSYLLRIKSKTIYASNDRVMSSQVQ